MSDNNTNVHVLQLSSYTSPVIQESKKDEWVEYGVNNDFYQYLIDRYTGSATNNAIINNICRLIYGRGLGALNASQHPNEYAQMVTLFPKEEVRKMVDDLYLLGGAMIQVIYSKDRKKIVSVYHSPVQLWRSEKCDENGDIKGYYYSDNWNDTKKFPPKRVPAFGTSNEGLEVMFVRKYTVGMKYYSLVDYQGALPYALLEEEISDYLINEVQNGFSGTKVVNFNNGIPSEEQQNVTSRKVLNKLTGSKGQKVIVSFNQNAEMRTTVDDIPLNDAPKHYEYLSEECLRKIMLSHNVTSPLLFGVGSANGFSSNADEMRNAAILFENMVINPKQQVLIDSYYTILSYNGVNSLELYFDSLNPLDASGDLTKDDSNSRVIEAINSLSPLVANKVLESMTPNEIRALVGLEAESGGGQIAQSVEMSVCLSHEDDLNDDEFNGILETLEGESLGDEWELVDTREYKEDNESIEDWANRLIKPKKTFLTKLAEVIKAQPSRDSYLDKSVYKVRYQYSERYSSANSREFCKQMMSRTNSGVVYRLEDIDRASRAGVNKELGHEKQPYDLFKFKGGVNCSHYWSEALYRLKKDTEFKSLSSAKEVSSIPKTYQPRPTGNAQSKIAPKDMPYNGHHPNWIKKNIG